MLTVNRFISTSLVGLTLLCSISFPTVYAAEPGTMSRKLLLENPVDLPSKAINAKIIKVTFPPAYKTPKHTHDGPGPRYVSKGKLRVTEGDKTDTYNAGEVFWESGQLMSVENIGNSEAELIIFELAPSH